MAGPRDILPSAQRLRERLRHGVARPLPVAGESEQRRRASPFTRCNGSTIAAFSVPAGACRATHYRSEDRRVKRSP
jgi:hypothetical protein